MDMKLLLDKKTTLEATFNEQNAERQKLADELAKIDTELLKLQGEYRAITELMENNTKGTKDAK